LLSISKPFPKNLINKQSLLSLLPRHKPTGAFRFCDIPFDVICVL